MTNVRGNLSCQTRHDLHSIGSELTRAATRRQWRAQSLPCPKSVPKLRKAI